MNFPDLQSVAAPGNCVEPHQLRSIVPNRQFTAMPSKKRIFAFLDHDIIIRHFIMSGIFHPLMEKHEVSFFFPEPGYKDGRRVSLNVSSLGLGTRVCHLRVHQDRLRLWTKLCQVGRLRWRPGGHYAAMRKIIRSAIGPGHVREYATLALPGIYDWFKWRTLTALKCMANHEMEELLDRERPDAVIHPTVLYGPYIHDLCEATSRRGIPLVAIMNSWDNPTTKANMYLKPDWLLVWGEQTKRHAEKYLKASPEKTIVFGAAQFDVYRDAPRFSRQEFCHQHSISADKILLLYAGSSKGTDEYAHLCRLDDAIETKAFPDVVVVYRPHPWGDGGKNGGRIIDHPWRHVVIESSMRTYLEQVKRHGEAKSLPDYRITRDVLASVDAVISPLSTILIEAAMLGKPPLCLLPIEDGARHFELAAPLVHFQEIFERPEFMVARGIEDLLPKLSELLERARDPCFREQLRQASRFIVETFDEPFGTRLNEFVERIAVHS